MWKEGISSKEVNYKVSYAEIYISDQDVFAKTRKGKIRNEATVLFFYLC